MFVFLLGHHARQRPGGDQLAVRGPERPRGGAQLREHPDRVQQDRPGRHRRVLPELPVHGEHRRRVERHGVLLVRLSPGSASLTVSRAQGILNEVWKNKLIFVETPDANETSIALENYRRVRMLLDLCSVILSH